MNRTLLRTLILEDSDEDSELLIRELQSGGYEVHSKQVKTPIELKALLTAEDWDIVFSDFSLLNLNSFDALALLKESGKEVPFVIVSRPIGEERAVLAIKAGATDYILKGNLKRLLPVVDRALREAARKPTS